MQNGTSLALVVGMKKVFKLVGSLTVLAISVSGSAQTQLSTDQAKALKVAKEAGVAVSQQDITFDGATKTLVVLGVSSEASAEASKSATDLIASFRFRMIEGYSGNGKMPWISEVTALALTKMSSSDQGNAMTSFSSAALKGYLAVPDGEIFFKGCRLGRVTTSGFYYDEAAIQNVIDGIQKGEVAGFFRSLSRFTDNIKKVRQSLSLAGMTFSQAEYPCQLSEDRSGLNGGFGVAIEQGDLGIWSTDKTCGDLFCSLQNFSKPSSRELRMIDNIYQYFIEFPDFDKAVVVVNRAHMAGIEKLLPNWPQAREQYLAPKK